MSASLTSGTYREPLFSGALRQVVGGLFGRRAAKATRAVPSFRERYREAEEVRALARSVEKDCPGFASDLYAAALRHEGLDD